MRLDELLPGGSIACFPSDADDQSALIVAADRAL
jgi:hypothetical protein